MKFYIPQKIIYMYMYRVLACILFYHLLTTGVDYTVQVDRQESAREQKRAEVLDSMKRLFPGVVSKFIVLWSV